MKYLSVLLVVILLFSVTSCQIRSIESTPESQLTTSCAHEWNAATCTEPKTCSNCKETTGEALGHTTDSGICTRCGESFSKWEVGEYEDEFGQPTGEKYILVDAYGTFSNSATTDSTLFAALQVDQNKVRIMLWEYGRNLVKGTFDSENYDITILDESGTKYYFTGTIYKGNTRIYFNSDDRDSVLSLLQNNDTLKIHLKSTKYSVSSYLFTIDTAGFDATYNSIT